MAIQHKACKGYTETESHGESDRKGDQGVIEVAEGSAGDDDGVSDGGGSGGRGDGVGHGSGGISNSALYFTTYLCTYHLTVLNRGEEENKNICK